MGRLRVRVNSVSTFRCSNKASQDFFLIAFIIFIGLRASPCTVDLDDAVSMPRTLRHSMKFIQILCFFSGCVAVPVAEALRTGTQVPRDDDAAVPERNTPRSLLY